MLVNEQFDIVKHKASSKQETRQRILDTAAALFADHGFRAVSLRRITKEAGVNIAAVSYHFGSRGDLVYEVLSQVVSSINEERLRMLSDAEGRYTNQSAPIEEVLEAFFRPVVSEMVETGLRSSAYLKLAGRCLAEEDEQFPQAVLQLFEEVARRFETAAQRSLPHLDTVDILWRLHLAVGTLLYALTHSDRVVLFSRGLIERIDPEETLQRLIDFTAAGMREGKSDPKRKQAKKGPLRSAVGAMIAGLSLFACSCGTARSPGDAKHLTYLDTPAHWMAGDAYAHESFPDTFWVDEFGDKQLSSFVKESLRHNRNLKAAQARLDAAAANARMAGADLYPHVSAGLAGRRQKQNFIGLPIPGFPPGSVLSSHSNSFGLSLDVSWEVDLWGKIRAAESAAVAEFEASEFDRTSAELSLAAQSTKVWFAMAEARDQAALAERRLTAFEKTERSIRDRFEGGIDELGQSPASQLLLAETDVATARDGLLAQQQLMERSSRQLEVMAGKYPAGKAGKHAKLPAFPKQVPSGLPATLLDRRPDLAAAERRIASADQRLLEAKKMLLPALSLTAGGGTSTESLSQILDGDFSVWSLAGNLAQPILQGGRLKANVSRREAERNLAAAEFEQKALTAFSEVENALAAERFFSQRIVALAAAVKTSRSAFLRSREDYVNGTGDFLTLLTAQQRLYAQESQWLSLRRMRLENRVDLYLALGGSFRVCPAPVTPPGKT